MAGCRPIDPRSPLTVGSQPFQDLVGKAGPLLDGRIVVHRFGQVLISFEYDLIRRGLNSSDGMHACQQSLYGPFLERSVEAKLGGVGDEREAARCGIEGDVLQETSVEIGLPAVGEAEQADHPPVAAPQLDLLAVGMFSPVADVRE